LLQWAFDTLDLNRIRAETDTRNGASARVLEKIGFVREGTLREDCVVNGDVSDSWVFGLIRREWRPQSGRFPPAEFVSVARRRARPPLLHSAVLTEPKHRRRLPLPFRGRQRRLRRFSGLPQRDSLKLSEWSAPDKSGHRRLLNP
jgi:hypothetical protein